MLAAAALRLRGLPGRPTKGAAAAPPVVPRRLLDVPGAAEYLNLSVWTIRDLIASGTLSRVRVPLPHGGELRRVLLDRDDLDQLIAAWKDRA